jgi:hypothetical protein
MVLANKAISGWTLTVSLERDRSGHIRFLRLAATLVELSGTGLAHAQWDRNFTKRLLRIQITFIDKIENVESHFVNETHSTMWLHEECHVPINFVNFSDVTCVRTMQTISRVKQRTTGCLWSIFVGDSLSMPVHWFYNRTHITQMFGYIDCYKDCPPTHPTSILNLSSTGTGGRGIVFPHTCVCVCFFFTF